MSARGMVRIVGAASVPDMPLAPWDCRIEVCQDDGTWVQMRGLCSARIHIDPAEIVTAHLVIEPGCIELTNMMVGGMQLDKFAGWWRRLLFKLKGAV